MEDGSPKNFIKTELKFFMLLRIWLNRLSQKSLYLVTPKTGENENERLFCIFTVHDKLLNFC